MRAADLCARLGGEEFGVLMLVSGPDEALHLANKLRRRIEEAQILVDHATEVQIAVTVSLGVATGTQSLENLLRLADSALYRAKEQGRNQVVYAFRRKHHQAAPARRARRWRTLP